LNGLVGCAFIGMICDTPSINATIAEIPIAKDSTAESINTFFLDHKNTKYFLDFTCTATSH
jgi:hypothetical protein